MTNPSVSTSIPPGEPPGDAAQPVPEGTSKAVGLGLAPLRAALLLRARAAAADIFDAAAADRSSVVAAALGEVDLLLSQAREQGRVDGEELLATERAAARASDRARLLAAQRKVYEALRHAARQRVRDLLDEPGMRDRLAAAMAERLGTGAVVIDTSDGGLTGRTPDGRSIDASVSALIDSALSQLEVTPLWTPE